MNRITAGARSRFAYLFGSAAAKPAPVAKAKVRAAQPGPAPRPATSKPNARPADFSHLLQASRARDGHQPAPVTLKPRPRSLGQQIVELQARMNGEPVPTAAIDTGPEQPKREQPKREQPKRRKDGTSTLGDQVAALQKKFGVS